MPITTNNNMPPERCVVRRASLLFLLLPILLLISCSENDPGEPIGPGNDAFNPGEGVFILNEGGFNFGNAAVDYYRFDDQILRREIFREANGRPLGDVLQSMQIISGMGYLVVNNSNRIERVDPVNFELMGAIEGLNSPRYLANLDGQTAFVSDFKADAVSVLDLENLTTTGQISLPGWSEELVLLEGRLFVTIRDSDQIYVIDPNSRRITDSIEVAPQPSALTIDAEGRLWIYSTGDEPAGVAGALTRVNPTSLQIQSTVPLPDFAIGGWPRLTINPAGDTLYCMKEDLFKIPVDASSWPGQAFLPANGRTLYGLGINPDNGEVYLGDARDFQQRGRVFRYGATGAPIDTVTVGVIPNGFVFF